MQASQSCPTAWARLPHPGGAELASAGGERHPAIRIALRRPQQLLYSWLARQTLTRSFSAGLCGYNPAGAALLACSSLGRVIHAGAVDWDPHRRRTPADWQGRRRLLPPSYLPAAAAHLLHASDAEEAAASCSGVWE